MANKENQPNTAVLERGDIYFFYRPRVEEEVVKSFADIERFYMILHPTGEKKYRLFVIGEKKLPEIINKDRINWGFVENVSGEAKVVEDELDKKEYETKTRGKRFISSVRPAGEGVYAIVTHDNHTHLAYILELPKMLGEVQQALNIKKEGSYIISVKNPEKPTPPGVGLRPTARVSFPSELQELFHNRRFAKLQPTDFLNYKNAEILLIGAAQDVYKELGVRLNPQEENEMTAEMFSDLKLEKNLHIIEPLFKGKWR